MKAVDIGEPVKHLRKNHRGMLHQKTIDNMLEIICQLDILVCGIKLSEQNVIRQIDERVWRTLLKFSTDRTCCDFQVVLCCYTKRQTRSTSVLLLDMNKGNPLHLISLDNLKLPKLLLETVGSS